MRISTRFLAAASIAALSMLAGFETPSSGEILVDGHSLAFRSFYAFSKGGEGGLSTKEGVPTSVEKPRPMRVK